MRTRIVPLALAASAGWLLWRRRGQSRPRVYVAWRDGAELDLGNGAPERARLVRVAREVLG